MVPPEQHRLLGNHGNPPAKLLQVQLPHIHPIHQNLALGGVIKPGDQIHQSGFAGAGSADDPTV